MTKMSLLDDPKNRRFARLFEYRRQKSLAESALLSIQRRLFIKPSPEALNALRDTAAHSLTRFR